MKRFSVSTRRLVFYLSLLILMRLCLASCQEKRGNASSSRQFRRLDSLEGSEESALLPLLIPYIIVGLSVVHEVRF